MPILNHESSQQFLGGTIIGPVVEVCIVKIIEEHGSEISIPSTLNSREASHVVISRETQRFVHEIHDHKKELRSSSELLTAFRKSEGKEPGVVGGSNGNKETCANPLSNPLSDSLCKTVIPTSERKWIAIDANPSPRNGLPTQVSKMVTKMVRHCDQDEREQDGSYHWETVRSLFADRICTGKRKIIF